eukprot:927249-Prymnesium_polylepis.1
MAALLNIGPYHECLSLGGAAFERFVRRPDHLWGSWAFGVSPPSRGGAGRGPPPASRAAGDRRRDGCVGTWPMDGQKPSRESGDRRLVAGRTLAARRTGHGATATRSSPRCRRLSQSRWAGPTSGAEGVNYTLSSLDSAPQAQEDPTPRPRCRRSEADWTACSQAARPAVAFACSSRWLRCFSQSP